MLFIANHKTYVTTIKDAEKIFKITSEVSNNVKVVLCPSFVFIDRAIQFCKTIRKKNIAVGSQNFFEKNEGMHTGAVTLLQLRDLGIRYSIVGHSEVADMPNVVHQKIRACIDADITPIVCIGEQTRDESGAFLRSLEVTTRTLFAEFSKQQLERMIIAYEPVWAIGGGAHGVCTVQHFEESVRYIKKVLHDMTNHMPVGKLSFVYGGSVNADTVAPFFESELCEGFLVGHASTDAVALKELLKALDSFVLEKEH